METMVFDCGDSAYLVSAAKLVRTEETFRDAAAETLTDWSVSSLTETNPFLQWISGDFVESDKPNSNKQFWTAGDLELAEYSIKYAPLNMVHKMRQPIGFFAATKTVRLDKAAEDERLKIQALSGLWTHIFPFEAAQAEAADEAGLLFYSMECRGTHLTCAGDEGCGETFEYLAVESHCEHLLERSSIRHIVNPTFRGGALIVPPVRPGWQEAHASVLSDAVMQEAASYAEQNEAQYKMLNEQGADLSAVAWEQLMGMIVVSAGRRA